MTLLWVALGAMVGAPLRYLADRALNVGHGFPWGTFVVNVAGSLVLGALVASPAGAVADAAVGAGFCGALTTYSTFGSEVVREARVRPRGAATYALASLVAGLGAAWLGMALVGLL